MNDRSPRLRAYGGTTTNLMIGTIDKAYTSSVCGCVGGSVWDMHLLSRAKCDVFCHHRVSDHEGNISDRKTCLWTIFDFPCALHWVSILMYFYRWRRLIYFGCIQQNSTYMLFPSSRPSSNGSVHPITSLAINQSKCSHSPKKINPPFCNA